MDYVALGKSNLLVSRTALGAMALANVSDDEQAAKIISSAYEGGINFFDTSRTSEESEKRLGNALHGSIRKDIFVATKTKARSSDEIARDLDLSLTALKTDYIDLYQLHWPDDITPFEETFGAIEKLVRQGKVRYVGVSNVTPEQMDEIGKIVPIVSLQMPYNMLDR